MYRHYFNTLHEYSNTDYARWCTHIIMQAYETSIYSLMYPWLLYLAEISISYYH